MLVLTRKSGEKIMIGDNITITVVAIEGNRVRIGLEAPQEIPITRPKKETKPSSKNHPTQE